MKNFLFCLSGLFALCFVALHGDAHAQNVQQKVRQNANISAAAKATETAARNIQQLSVYTRDGTNSVEKGGDDYVQLSIPLGASARADKVFTLVSPPRLVVDVVVPDTRLARYSLSDKEESAYVKSLRVGAFSSSVLRLVFDLDSDAYVAEKKTASGRLNVTLRHSDAITKGAQSVADTVSSAMPVPRRKPARTYFKERTYRVVIDAGHGGKDPGAVGKKSNEKDVTLHYAELLEEAFKREPNIETYMIREDDSFILLRERVAKARAAKGDIFISLHADAHEDRSVQGFSVYTLSDEASDMETELLATQENKVDVIGGVDISAQESDVANILVDLVRRETQNKSVLLAESIVENMPSRVKGTRNTHRYAGFAVLKAPDISSVLIEMGFLSNASDEKALMSREYQQAIVRGIVSGVKAYIAAQ